MRLLAPILIVMSCCFSIVVFGSQPVEKSAVISTYKQLLALRKTDSELLLSGNGVMVIGSSAQSKLQPLDIVLTLNTKPIYSVSNLQHRIAVNNSGKHSYSVKVHRAGRVVSLALSPQDFELKLSDMNPIELGQILSSVSSSSAAQYGIDRNNAMTSQYLKGRPFRTPNNRTGYAELPTRPSQ